MWWYKVSWQTVRQSESNNSFIRKTHFYGFSSEFSSWCEFCSFFSVVSRRFMCFIICIDFCLFYVLHFWLFAAFWSAVAVFKCGAEMKSTYTQWLVWQKYRCKMERIKFEMKPCHAPVFQVKCQGSIQCVSRFLIRALVWFRFLVNKAFRT